MAKKVNKNGSRYLEDLINAAKAAVVGYPRAEFTVMRSGMTSQICNSQNWDSLSICVLLHEILSKSHEIFSNDPEHDLWLNLVSLPVTLETEHSEHLTY